MGDKEKAVLKRFLIILVSLTLLTYIIYQAYMMVYDPVKTEVAFNQTINDTVDTEVFVVRNESYIQNGTEGTIISVVDDGSRVAKGQEVAVVFSDTSAAATYTQLNELKASIDRYQKLANQTDNYTFDINDLDDNISASVMDLVDIVDSGKLTNLSDGVDTVRDQVITRQIATGNTLDFEKRLTELQGQYDSLSKESSTHSTITSEQSGYYISGVDGYETLVDYGKVKDLSVDKIYEIMKSKPLDVPSGAIGKIVNDFAWYFVCVVDANSIGNLSVGDVLTVNLPFSSVNSVKATVEAINDNTGDKTAVILSCNRMNSDISSLRHESAELVVDSYTGLKVSSSSIRVNKDGEKGVYVLNGNIVDFKKLNIIYSGKDYVLSGTDDTDDSFVSLYDNVITEGKDLYDGKIIK